MTQHTEVTDETEPLTAPARTGAHRSRLWSLLALLTLLLLLAFLPPLLSLSRYQRRIAGSISLSLGRPVHLDHVALNLLPLPSLSIQKFVVDEDPAFGEEPIVRAETVVANLRVSSLWRRHIEISRIRFTDPSVNLVLRPDGRWNLEDVLLQAAHIDAAPTAQRNAGAAPRFPYIEATGARLNLKLGPTKTPFSLSEADFALWLPEPQQWRMRLKAKPVRTDISVTDSGSLEAEVTLRRAPSASLVPLSLAAAWRNAPLGETSRILFGRDIGVRGAMDISAKAEGTLAESSLDWHVNLLGLHRADFVPAEPVRVAIDCAARAQRVFHAFADIRCNWPVPDSNGATLALTGSMPDLLHPTIAELQLGTGRLPAATLLGWLRVLSRRIPPDLSAAGSLSASLSHEPATALSVWSGEIILDQPALSGAALDAEALTPGTVLVSTGPGPSTPVRPASISGRTSPRTTARSRALAGSGVSGSTLATTSEQALIQPVTIPLGGPSPAVLEGRADRRGVTLHLSGTVLLSRLVALSRALPPLADGLPNVLPHSRGTVPVHVDLTATRPWGGPQTWTDNAIGSGPVTPQYAGRK